MPDTPSKDRPRRWPGSERPGRAARNRARTGGAFHASLLDGPGWVEASVRHVLAPTLRPGDTVVTDTLSSHKRVAARAGTGAELRVFPPHSPDVTPIETAFSKLEALLRPAAERTVEGLRTAIGPLVDLTPTAACATVFTATGSAPK